MYLTCMYHTLYYDRSAAVAVYIQFLFMYKKQTQLYIMVYTRRYSNKQNKKVKYNDYDLQ